MVAAPRSVVESVGPPGPRLLSRVNPLQGRGHPLPEPGSGTKNAVRSPRRFPDCDKCRCITTHSELAIRMKISRRVVSMRRLLAVAAVFAGLLVSAQVRAASPASGTVSQANPVVSWTGGPLVPIAAG